MDQTCEYYCYKNKRNTLKYDLDKIERVEIVFFDMDGVLTDCISSWKYVHDYFNTSNHRSVDKYLKGEIDDLEFIKKDVSLWKENGKFTSYEKLSKILYEIPVMKGAKDLFSFLKKNKIKTAIVSAGIDILAKKVAKHLDIDFVFSNGFEFDDKGILTGEGVLNVELSYKDKNIAYLANSLDIEQKNCISVGNSCFDIPMFEASGIGIAFNPEDECVKKAADIIIEEKDLEKLISAIEKFVK